MIGTGKKLLCDGMLCAKVYDWEFCEIPIFTVIFNVSFDLIAVASLHRGSMFSLV